MERIICYWNTRIFIRHIFFWHFWFTLVVKKEGKCCAIILKNKFCSLFIKLLFVFWDHSSGFRLKLIEFECCWIIKLRRIQLRSIALSENKDCFYGVEIKFDFYSFRLILSNKDGLWVDICEICHILHKLFVRRKLKNVCFAQIQGQLHQYASN